MIAGPLSGIAVRLSDLLSREWRHEALVIFTRECTGRPRKVAGRPEVVDRITIDELERIRSSLNPGEVSGGVRTLAGAERDVWMVRDDTGTLLVVVVDSAQPHPPWPERVAAWFAIVATAIGHQVIQASPDFLAESRAASSERARTIAELSDRYGVALSSILGTLRSRDLDDRRARMAASETASTALVALRTTAAADRNISEESVTAAFARQRGDLTPLLGLQNSCVEYVEPPVDGRPVPGEVAHAARSMARTIALALEEQTSIERLRISWDCDGECLLVELRDQSSGDLDAQTLRRQLVGRLQTLRGEVAIEAIPDWGSRVALRIPLDPPEARPDEPLLSTLNSRELEVLSRLATGMRNKPIAAELGISESTVKFHVAGLLQKLGVSNRGEAAAVAIRAGIV